MIYKKKRLDKILADRNLVDSQTKAKAIIMAGQVYVEGKQIIKSGLNFNDNSLIEIKSLGPEWVSRGALKLIKAIDEFNIDIKDKTCIDLGSSTGGFTDVLLKKGAKKIYCVDVGYGQLDWKIRNNKNVLVYEKTNARYLDNTIIKDKLDAIVCDTSFISLKKVLPASMMLLKKSGWLIGLIKPQFEIGKNLVGKGGVVRNQEHHKQVVKDIKYWLKEEKKFQIEGVIESPILGPKGNREFLILAYKN